MRKHYIDGTGRPWLDKYTAIVKRVSKPVSGYASLISILQVRHRLIVPADNVALCLADDNYTWLLFLPDGKHWCMTAIYDQGDQIVEWYFDITRTNSVDETGPYYEDLYLDIVLLPSGEIIVLDQDELAAAVDGGTIAAAEFHLAHRAWHELMREGIVSIDYVVPLCRSLLAVLSSAGPADGRQGRKGR